MNRIITQREAQDNHQAQLIAQGMENAGADVFSVAGDCRGYISVYCAHSAMISAEEIDAEIEKVLNKSGAFYQVG